MSGYIYPGGVEESVASATGYSAASAVDVLHREVFSVKYFGTPAVGELYVKRLLDDLGIRLSRDSEKPKDWEFNLFKPDPGGLILDENPVLWSVVQRVNLIRGLLSRVIELCGPDSGVTGVDVLAGMALTYAVNCTDLPLAGRYEFMVEAQNGQIIRVEFLQVEEILGRYKKDFFGAFANVIRTKLKNIHDVYDFYDMRKKTEAEILYSVAAARRISRYPYLAFDVADCVSSLTEQEALAVESSFRACAGEKR